MKFRVIVRELGVSPLTMSNCSYFNVEGSSEESVRTLIHKLIDHSKFVLERVEAVG